MSGAAGRSISSGIGRREGNHEHRMSAGKGQIISLSLIVAGMAVGVGLFLHLSDRQSDVQTAEHYDVPPDRIYLFKDLVGPPRTTVVPALSPTLPSRYGTGSASRFAILLTDRKSNWLGLAHGLKSIGVPFLITEDYREALHHRVVMVYPTISGRMLTPEALRALAAHPRNGGTLIGSDILGGGLQEVFGFQDIRPSRSHYMMTLVGQSPLLVSFIHPKGKNIRLGDRTKGIEPVGTNSFTQPKEEPLATYEDGSAAIIQRAYEAGHAYGIGLDIGYLILKGHNLRDEGIAESYDNRFEPTLDVFLRLLKAMYLAGEPDGVVLHTVPFQRSLSVLITHDIDAQTSMANSIRYAEFEQSQGIVGTYFIQTKYIKDYNDEIFFNEQGVRDMQQIRMLGMELGSHTVAHSKVLYAFPLGTGSEQYPTYVPFVKTRIRAANGSVLGELRVSKFLIEQLSGGPSVVSFRPGELSNPKALPEALTATGYRYSSSATANNSLTHLPYQLMIHRDEEMESNIFEFPVTIEDEALPEMGSRIPQAVDLAKNIARYGGSVVVLIHPNILGHKFEFEKNFVAAVKEFSWFSSVSQFGDWWAARNKVEADVAADGRWRIVSLEIPVPLAGLTLRVPKSWTLTKDRRHTVVASQEAGAVVLREVEGSVKLVFDVGTAPSDFLLR